MKITFRSVLLLVPANMVLLLLAGAFFGGLDYRTDPEALWQMPLVIAIGSVVMALVSLIVVVTAQRPLYDARIYFFGQLLITLAIIAIPAYMRGYNSVRHSRYGNIDNNYRFLNTDTTHINERLAAFSQLESGFTNRNDIDLGSYYFGGQDSLQPNLVIYFVYKTKEAGGVRLSSKHIIRDTGSEMVYAGVRLGKDAELMELKKRADLEFEKTIEDIQKSLKDTGSNKN